MEIINNLEINKLATLLPLDLYEVDEKLKTSIDNNSILSPVVMCDEIVCDGHKRLKALKSLGINHVDLVVVKGEPGLVYASLNANKNILPIQTAIAWKKTSEKNKTVFCQTLGISFSPQMQQALEFLSNNHSNLLSANSVSLNVFRELAHLKERMSDFAIAICKLDATVSQKRLASQLLRQCMKKNSLPCASELLAAKDAISLLQNYAQPRRSKCVNDYKAALDSLQLPPATTISIDLLFDKPGVELKTHIKRNEKNKLLQIQQSLNKLFEKVQEL